MITRDVDIHSLVLNPKDIWLLMGVREGTPDELTLSLIDEVTEEIFSIARPRYCYTIVKQVKFSYGRIISEALKDGDKFAITVATIGSEGDALLHNLQKKDIVKAFVADVIASEIAEATSRAAIKEITSHLADGENISNPYSPGYCGWPLREQRELFSYFDESPCGVILTESSLMLPIKSVSSVLAIGKNVVKAPYGCAICNKSDCYKKNK